MCSFTDKEVNEFIQFKKRRDGHLDTKRAISKVGLQDNGSWALSEKVIIGNDGEPIPPEDSPYIWIGHLLDGPGVAKPSDAIPLSLPLNKKQLQPLIVALKSILAHNFFPGMLLFGACAMALHYEAILAKYMNCPVPIAFGVSGTGKTTALRCGLALVGGSNRFFSRGTKEKYLDLCCNGTIPIGIDDPSFQKDIDVLCLDLFNGAKSGSISRGEKKPHTTAVIAANFTASSTEK